MLIHLTPVYLGSQIYCSLPFIPPQHCNTGVHTGYVSLELCKNGRAIISVAELSAMKLITEHPELPLTKERLLSSWNSHVTEASQASSFAWLIPKTQSQWRNHTEQPRSVLYCMFGFTVDRKRKNMLSSNWKMCPVIIMYLPCSKGSLLNARKESSVWFAVNQVESLNEC